MPPTITTSSISLGVIPASLSAALQGFMVRLTRSSTSFSRSALVIFNVRCFGPEASAVMNGRFMSVLLELDSSILAFSAASFNLCKASLSFFRSIPFSFLKLSARNSTILVSKSSPPKNVSPLVAFTSNTPSPISSIETSKVPPPRS